MTPLDDSTAVALGLISLLLWAALYVWTSAALAALFRKAGVEPWKAWVPFLNTAVLLQLGGFSGWLVLLAFVPLVNIALFVVLIISCHRINQAFGYGAGMTVLAALLLPVWASIVGFGPARWLGRELAAGGAGPLRTAGVPDPAWTATHPGPPAFGALPYPPGGYAAATGHTGPAPVVPPPYPHAGAPAHPGAEQSHAREGAQHSEQSHPAEPYAPPAGGWTPPPLPAPPVPPAASDRSRADDGFELPPVGEYTDEVTAAVTGAPSPISAVPAAAAPWSSEHEPAPSTADAHADPLDTVPQSTTQSEAEEDAFDAFEKTAGREAAAVPPVTRVPLAPPPAPQREPWEPAPLGEHEAFPETSGPVSAIAGAPDAGSPRSARSSVSALHTKPEIPDDDEFDQTVVARRKRADWVLVPPSGEPIDLASDVAILGRRPVADAGHQDAQLIVIADDTRTVSKTHALLERRDDVWYITDLDSTNGVVFPTVMGTEVEIESGVAVEAGDRFLLGDAEIFLRRSDG